MAVGVIGLVFLPQHHERHALFAQFVMHASLVGLHLRARPLECDEQSPFQRNVVAGLNVWPGQAGCCRQPNVLYDHAFGQAEGSRNLFMGELGVELQTQYVLDLRIVILCAGMLSPDK